MLRKVLKVIPKESSILCYFPGNEVVEYDLSDVLSSDGPMAVPLKSSDFFKKVFIEAGTPTWPNGFDVCADEIYMHGKHISKNKAS